MQFPKTELLTRAEFRCERDFFKISEVIGLSRYDRSLEKCAPEVAAQWDYEENYPKTPKDVFYGSSHKAAWKCEKGHKWRAVISSRSNRGCPYCGNKKVWVGFNDLFTTHREIAMQWHPTKNGGLTPYDVTAGSKTRVWWICEKGHSYEARVNERTGRGYGCTICSGKQVLVGFNDLGSQRPKLKNQWHPTKNGNKTPESVTVFSGDKVWWMCPKCNVEWEDTIRNRSTTEGDCPFCGHRITKLKTGFNDLATTHPNLAKQWHPTKNNGLKPTEVRAGDSTEVWWICEKGHEWLVRIVSRTRGDTGCPKCVAKARAKKLCIPEPGKDLKSLYGDLANEWYQENNGDLTPDQVKPNSN